MGILAFERTHESGNIGEGLRRKYDVEFLVTCDTVRMNVLQIAFDRRCPKYGDRYTGVDNLALANDIQIERLKGSKYHWTVKVTYDSEVKVDEDEENPLKRRPKISLASEFDKTDATRDRNGLLYCNTAGDPIQGAQIDVVRWKIKFSRNIPVDFPEWLLSCANKLNDAPVKLRGLTFPKNTLRVTALEIGDEEKENDVWFSAFSLELSYDELCWKDFLINQGFNEIDPLNKGFANGKSFPIKRKILIKGEPPAEPVFLDKKGSRIHEIVTVRGVKTVVYKDPPDAKDIVVLERDPYYEFSYSKLPLK